MQINNKKIENSDVFLIYLKEEISAKLDINSFDRKRKLFLIQRQILVQVLDQQWKAHLLGLDQLRQGIGLRAYAQRDPLNEYKRNPLLCLKKC